MRSRILFIAALLLVLIAVSPQQHSCHAAGKVIAAIMSSNQPRYREAHRAFVKSLAARGYTAATTRIILQSPNPDPQSWSNTIRKFNAYRPDLIVAYGAPAALVAMRESQGIPVVVVDMYAIEKSRGMCGVTSRVPMFILIKAIQDIRPYRRVGVIYTAREAGSQLQLDDIKKAAHQFGMVVNAGNVTSAASLEAVLGAMLDKVDVVIATESSIVYKQFDRIVARARAHNIPVVGTTPNATENGALVSLEINPEEQGLLGAEIASRILEGAKADHLSLLIPQRVELVVNMRVAGALGLTIPFAVLNSAARVVK